MLHRHDRRRRGRGGGFLLFLAVLLPFTLIGVALAADYSRAILVGRYAINATDAIAMAAATAIDDTAGVSDLRLDEKEARTRANEMCGQIVAVGMLHEQSCSSVKVDFVNNGRTVQITLTYTVPELFVVRTITGQHITINGKVIRSAGVCDPDSADELDNASTSAGCAYPIH